MKKPEKQRRDMEKENSERGLTIINVEERRSSFVVPKD